MQLKQSSSAESDTKGNLSAPAKMPVRDIVIIIFTTLLTLMVLSTLLFTIINQSKGETGLISEETIPLEKTTLLPETNDQTAVVTDQPDKPDEQRTSTSAENVKTLPSVHDISVGDKLGSFIVESIDIGNYIHGQSFTVTFTGEATVSGETWVGMGGICFHKLSETDIAKIPTLQELPEADVCLTEDTIELRNKLGIFGPPYDVGPYKTIAINNFTLQSIPKGAPGKTAQLVRIIK